MDLSSKASSTSVAALERSERYVSFETVSLPIASNKRVPDTSFFTGHANENGGSILVAE